MPVIMNLTPNLSVQVQEDHCYHTEVRFLSLYNVSKFTEDIWDGRQASMRARLHVFERAKTNVTHSSEMKLTNTAWQTQL